MGMYSRRLSRTSAFLKAFKTNRNAFHLIFITTWMMGIPIARVHIRSDLLLNIFVKIWCFGLLIVKSVSRLITFANLYKILPDFVSQFSFYFFNILSLITETIFIMKRHEISSAIKSMIDISAKISPGTYVGSKTIYIEVLIMAVSVISILALLVIFFFFQEWDYYLNIVYTPFPEKHSIYTHIVLSLGVFIQIFSVAINFISIIFCYSSFIATGDMLNGYAKTIQELKSHDPDPIIRSLRMFQKISDCVKSIDAAFNVSAFFIFGTVVGNIFASVSVMCSETKFFHTPVARIFVALTLLSGMIAIFVLTSAGNTVSIGMQHVKEALVQCSEKMTRRPPNVVRSFCLLSDSIRDSSLVVTGCGMFTINKPLMLTVGGMVITYSFLLFQLNGNPIST
ncbi:hypothetical protein AVEN_153932-1 [Araneus ventricosus]|uniref:Gustatory receptor n=1 Tax=Araneus ventricosus TaxID=182803 RepID=A0A4Y2F8I6_ARAVE|nr:hypothetical protein AVEN_153932-1 [Araneus ventricosus]